MRDESWTFKTGRSPLVATAIHNGHALRPEVEKLTALNKAQRLREEDPFTGEMTDIADNQIRVFTSRFEVDLNRPREKAVYSTPDDAWGLTVWKQPLPVAVMNRSLSNYDQFYRELLAYLKDIEQLYGRFIVLDLHSYCHRRNGPNCPPDIQNNNPDINIGTGTMQRSRWANVVDRFMTDLKSTQFKGKSLDVRENIRFRGGWFSRWIHETFPETGCALAVEIKKIFMDEWTGKLDQGAFDEIKTALESTIPGLLQEFKKVK